MPTCKKCGLPISFSKLPSGKWYPVNTDGSEHWGICSQTRNKDKIYLPIASEWITGKNYVHTPSDKLPWED